MPTIRELYKKGIRTISRIDEPGGRYIWCPKDAFFKDSRGELNLFYCNLYSADHRIIKYGFVVNLDKEGYCAYGIT